MTGTADGEPPHALETSEAQAYFRAVETAFLALRRTPLLLSPADWRVARGWFEAGVPLDLVRETLRELYARRRERDPEARIQSLRYFDRAVRSAWKAWQETRGPHFAPGPEETPAATGERLEALARRLPKSLPDHEAWQERIRSLSGSLREIEEALGALDVELLERLDREVEPAMRGDIERTVDEAIARLAVRTGPEDRAALRSQLFRRELRRRLDLPLLTLF
jgi:hypothetical protein